MFVCYTSACPMDELPGGKRAAIRWRSLAKTQKISASLLSVAGIVVFVLSFQELQANIRNPFTVSTANLKTAKTTIENLSPDQREAELAKRRDTDGDGISDADEVK